MPKLIKKGTTGRGFAKHTFKDYNGEECSVQKSSIATDDLIWLGCNRTNLKYFIPFGNPAWNEIKDEDLPAKFGAQHVNTNTHMHLTRKQVKALLPILTKFVEEGEI